MLVAGSVNWSGPGPLAAAHWSHVGSGPLAQSSANSDSVSYPAGVASGDLLLLGCQGRRNAHDWSATGYTSLTYADSLGGLRFEILYRWADGSEGAALSVSTPQGTINGWSCELTAFRGGVGSGSPLDVPVAQGSGSGSSMLAPSVTTTQSDVLVTRWFASMDDNTHGSPSTGSLAFGGAAYNADVGVDHAASMSYLVQAAAGASGSSSMQQTTNASDGWNGLTLAFAPGAGGPPPVNTPPTAQNDDYATAVDTPLNVAAPGVLGNDTDVDPGDTLTAVLGTDVSDGSLTFNANGSFSYTPDTGFIGDDTFTYTANDGTDNSTPATVTISVSSVPPPPPPGDWSHVGSGPLAQSSANSDSVSYPAGVASGDLLLLGCQGRRNAHDWSATGYTSLTYADSLGGLRFEILYRWADGSEGAALSVSTPQGTINGWSCELTAFRGGVGSGSPLDVPVAQGSGSGSSMLAPSVTTTQSDVLVTRWFASMDDNTHGSPSTGSLAFGGAAYNADVGVDHAASMSYLVQAAAGASGSSSMQQTTNASDGWNGLTLAFAPGAGGPPPVNTPPTAQNDDYATAVDTPLNVAAPGVLGNDTDVDPGDTLTAVLGTDVSDGSLTFNANGSFSYTPDTGFIGDDTFTYTANDGTDNSTPATVTISVSSVPPPPPPGDWSHVGSGPLAQSSANSDSVSYPAGVASGDLLLLGCQGRRNAHDWSATGYTSLTYADSLGGLRFEILYRWADGSEGAALSVSTPQGTINGWSCELTAFRGGVGSGSPLDVPVAQGSGSGSSMLAPSVTTTQSDVLVTRWFASMDDNTHGSPSTGSLAFGGAAYNADVGVDHAASMSYLVQAAAGASGSSSMQQTTNASDGWNGLTLAFAPGDFTPPTGIGAASITINGSAGIDASTFETGSFSVTNTSTETLEIDSVTIDLSTSVLPDLVFDPSGSAGDAAGKCLTIDSGGGVTGFQAPANLCTTPFSSPHDGSAADGYDVLTLTFADFDPGETIAFSVDIDPTSIKDAAGTGSSGSVSGLELTGASIGIEFTDGSQSNHAFAELTADGGSAALFQAGAPVAPALAVDGVPLAPTTLSTRHSAASVTEAAQEIVVSGPAGASVRLLHLHAGLAATPGYDIEPFEANTAEDVTRYAATIGGGGSVAIPVTLTNAGALNYFVATLVATGGHTGPTSNIVILDLTPEPGTGAATFEITPNSSIGASTFSGDSFTLTNTGDSAISSASIDLSTAYFPDVRFDPVGQAGDATSGCLVPHSSSSAVGYAAPADNCTTPFSGGSATDGYTTATLNFTDFDPGEQFVFTADVDPTTIKGFNSAGNAGAISGLELSGSTVDVTFANGLQTSRTFGDGSAGGSAAVVPSPVTTAVTLGVQGVTAVDGGFSNDAAVAAVPSAAQTAVVSGPAGTPVTLIVVDAVLEDEPSGGYHDLDPYERNKAVSVTYLPGTIGAGGTIDIPFAVSTDAGETTYITAAATSAGGDGPAAAPIYLEIGAGPGTGSATFDITPGAAIGASTFDADAFQITNTGTVPITDVTVDLSKTFFPDVRFDPVGQAGDNTAKCLVPDASSDAVGFDASGDECVDPFSGGSATAGYTTASMSFTDFGAGEQFVFSVDVDPTTIKGFSSAGNAGAISGLEMAGTQVTVTFADGVVVASTFGDGSDGGSSAVVTAAAPAPVSLAVDGVTTADGGFSNGAQTATVTDVSQNAVISGADGTDVTLIVVHADLEDEPSGGYNDLDDFERNQANSVTYASATIGPSGSVTIPFSASSVTGEATYLIAGAIAVDGAAAVTAPIYLELGDEPPAPGAAIYRVNAGGPQIGATDAGPDWSADTTAAPSTYLSPSYGDNTTFADADDPVTADASVPAYVPNDVFVTERYDPANAPQDEMTWEFPVASGTSYEVRLYLAEIWDEIAANGPRIFSVDIEGTVYGPYDIEDEVGTEIGTMKAFSAFVADDSLTITFLRDSQNPAVKALEILAGGESVTADAPAGGTVTTDTEGDGATALDTVETTLTTPNAGTVSLFEGGITGSPPTGYQYFGQQVDITAPDATVGDPLVIMFELDSSILPTGGPVEVFRNGVLIDACSGAPDAIPDPCVSDVTTQGDGDLQITILTSTASAWNFGYAPPPPTPGDVLHRVNAGGPQLTASDGGPAWSADTALAPHGFLVEPGSNDTATFPAVEPGPSVPATTPGEIFDTERWDAAGGEEMAWAFPVSVGTQVEVRIYMGNGYDGTSAPGQRVFDIVVDGSVPPNLDGIDLSGDYGHTVGAMEAVTLVSDGVVNIDFVHDVENPLINGIEIVVAGPTPDTLSVSPPSIDFGPVVFSSGAETQALTLTNLGASGDPSIDVTALTLAGSGDFSISSAPALPFTLLPGAFATVEITYDPGSTGFDVGTLTVAHSGLNSPVVVDIEGEGVSNLPVGFGSSGLAGEGVTNPTSLDFGPDGRLYVSEQDGDIWAFEVVRNGPNDYDVTATEQITDIKGIQNHNDDGTTTGVPGHRQVTGILATGTATNPVLYVTSSDPRISVGDDSGLDTNSGTISRLTWTGTDWEHVQLVRGLPRSEENHSTNGMDLDAATNTLYVMQGGHTNKGAPGNNFSGTPEYALSAAMLSVDLDTIEVMTTSTDVHGQSYKYNLPTLDDPTSSDSADPWGGNNGRNQAIIDSGGPVQVFSPGYRNAYDVVFSESGQLYTFDNGPNTGWGGIPVGEGSGGTCTNAFNEATSTGYGDGLHHVTSGYYGGHPNPTRASADSGLIVYVESGGSWVVQDSYDWSDFATPPVPSSLLDPIQCDYQIPGTENGALAIIGASTNGLAEYTASNFGGSMQGDLLAAAFNGNIYRFELNAAGDDVAAQQALFSGFGSQPLDLIAQPDAGPFPGTVWAVTYGSNNVTVFEPNDFDGGGGSCTGADDPTLDEDTDGYDNADEIDNGTDPCSAASEPHDFDGDLESDLNDPDDDDDGQPDTSDPFAIDALDGLGTAVPVACPADELATTETCLRFAPGSIPDTILDLGFTGLMTNGTSDWLDLYDPDDIIAGGAAPLLGLQVVGLGDAHLAGNDQANGFQFGITPPTAPFVVHARVVAPFDDDSDPQNFQSAGLQIGPGDQDNYLKLVANANGGAGGLQLALETDGTFVEKPTTTEAGVLGSGAAIDLYLIIDPGANTATARYSLDGGTTIQPYGADSTFAIPTSWLDGTQGLAVGVLATANGSSSAFSVDWDLLEAHLSSEAPELSASDESPTVEEGSTLDVTISATDLEGDTVTFTTVGSVPSFASLTDADPGDNQAELSLQPQAGDAAGSPYAIEIEGDDGNGNTDSVIVTISVTEPAVTGTVAYRVNVGGPTVASTDAGPDWGVDTTTSPSLTWVANGLNLYDTTSGDSTGDVGSGPPGVPLAVFNTERWDPGGIGDPADDELTYSFPVAAGAEVKVNVFVAEIYSGVAAAGDRVFDIAIDGTVPPPFADVDPFALGGGAGSVGSVVSATVTSDGAVDLTFLHQDENPNPKAIEVIILTPAGADLVGPADVDFGDVVVGDTASETVSITNPVGSDGPVEITALAVGGDTAFTIPAPPALPLTLNPGETVDVDVQFAPTAGGSVAGSLDVTHDGASALAVGLAGNGTEPSPVLYRVNAGGPELTSLDAGPNWAADTDAAPSPLHNAGSTQGAFPNTNGVDATVPASTPTSGTAEGSANVFVTERWDDIGSSEMEWDFPVAAGEFVEVRLYLHSGWDGASSAGQRKFDVTIDGVVKLNDYDIVADVGHRVGTMKSFVIASDGNIDIDFFHLSPAVQNPLVNAIEILTTEAEPPPPNSAPQCTDGSASVVSGETLNGSVDCVDDDADALTHTVVDDVDHGSLALDPDGSFSYIPAAGYLGPDSFTFLADDGTDPSNVATYSLTVQPPPGTILYRVNAGGPVVTAIDDGPDWEVDTLATPSGLHNAGGSVSDHGAVPIIDTSVAPTTPAAIFSHERWDGAAAPEMAWDFPVPAGTEVEVRIFFRNGYAGTSTNGTRVFDVLIDGANVLDDYDIVADVGHNVGTMKSFSITSDGTVDIDFGHETENPLLNAIEILVPEEDPAPEIVYRVNVGGPTLNLAGPSWLVDTSATPSPYRTAGGTSLFSTADAIGLDGSVPDGTPMAMFQTERWDPAGDPEMQWAFPVDNGATYEVRFYVAEIFIENAASTRVMDILVEGTVAVDDLNLFATYGHDVGAMIGYQVTMADASLDILFGHVVENPNIKGIEILKLP